MRLRQDRDTHLRAWASTVPKETGEELTVKQEIQAIGEAMTHKDREFLAQYGGFGGAPNPPRGKVTEGVSIDDYSTWRAVRFTDRDEVG